MRPSKLIILAAFSFATSAGYTKWYDAAVIAKRGEQQIALVGVAHYSELNAKVITENILCQSDEVFLENIDGLAWRQELRRAFGSRNYTIRNGPGSILLDEVNSYLKEAHRFTLSADSVELHPAFLYFVLSSLPSVPTLFSQLKDASIESEVVQQTKQSRVKLRGLRDAKADAAATLDSVPDRDWEAIIKGYLAAMRDSTTKYALAEFTTAQLIAVKYGHHTQLNSDLALANRQLLNNHYALTILHSWHPYWLDKILTSTSKHIVVVVGAAHLGSDSGLIRSLEKRGFNIQKARIEAMKKQCGIWRR